MHRFARFIARSGPWLGTGWLAVMLFTAGPATAKTDPDTYRIVEVIDGDTVVVATEQGKRLRVRMIGIDAPELRDTTKARIDARQTESDLEQLLSQGQRSRNYLVNDLQVTQFSHVYLQYDQHDLDSQGNTLAYVHICPISVAYPPGKYMQCPDCITQMKDHYCYLLNALILDAGYARVNPVPPNNRHTKFFQRLYKFAQHENRGLWETHTTSKPRVTKIKVDPVPVDVFRQPLISENQALTIARDHAKEKGHPVPDNWQYIGAIHHEAQDAWQVGIDFSPFGKGTRLEVWINDRSGDVFQFEAVEHQR